MRCLLASLGLAIVAAATGCSDPPLDCVQGLDVTCAPLYPPTFDNMFRDTLIPKCSTGGGSCHTPEGHQADLAFDELDPDAAYHQLMMNSTVHPDRERIAPGDPSCSVMIERVYSSAKRWHMPRGSNLADNERCAMVQWVAQGALRHPADAAPPPADANTVDAGVPDAK
jgi:hypothetical protein